MAASHIALRARSYGSFPVSADVHDKHWLQHSQERIAGRRSLEDRKSLALAYSGFLEAFPSLRDASHHLRFLLMGATSLKCYIRGETISDDKAPALVYILAGEAEKGSVTLGDKDTLDFGSGGLVRQGQGVGEGLLWDAPCPNLKAVSRTCCALVLTKTELMAIKAEMPQHFADFDAQLLLYRAWHNGEAGEKGLTAVEVQDLVRSLVDAARCDDSVTIRKVARERQALLGLSDTSALEGGALHVAAMQEKHSTLDTLLELGAPPGARSGSGHTPMHSAALVGNTTAVKKLLEKKGKLDSSNNKLRTPLHVAAQEVYAHVVGASSNSSADTQG